MKKKIRFLICICTRNRKNNLSQILKSLSKLKLSSKISLKIIVVENKKKINKKNVFKNKNIKFFTEKKIGISFARNRCLREAKNIKYNFLVFFDDDCIIDKNWLQENIKFIKKNKFDIITGPHISLNNPYLNLIERKFNNGSNIRWASTNNVVIKNTVLEKEKIIFDEQIQKIGGEDQLFFLQLKKRGYKIGWNNFSKVYEKSSKKRITFLWFIKRSFGYGCSSYFIYKKIFSNNFLFYIFMKIFYDILTSIFYLLVAPTNPKKFFLKFMHHLARSFGCISTTFIGYSLKRY